MDGKMKRWIGLIQTGELNSIIEDIQVCNFCNNNKLYIVYTIIINNNRIK